MSTTLDAFFRMLPDFKGKRRIARYLFHNRIQSDKGLLVKGSVGCSYHLPHLRESLAMDIFINGIYERSTHLYLKEHLAPNAVLLDLGANIGSVSIPLCKQRPDLKVIAVEAAPWIFEYLEKNVRENNLGQQITCINRALVESDGRQVSFYSPREGFGKGSLSPVFTQDAILIDTVTVDHLLEQMNLQRVDMIKIDIEGFEYFAFKGAAGLLKPADAPDILFEFVDWAEERAELKMGSAQRLLESWGYAIYILNEKNKLDLLPGALTSGSAMLLATKRARV